jgi:hypothetical protein
MEGIGRKKQQTIDKEQKLVKAKYDAFMVVRFA